jgi:hypothetical protein
VKKLHDVIVVGGGWAGTSAAIAAKKAGADVGLIERTDMLLGAGLVGGIMRNNGRFVAAEEAISLGCGDLFQIADSCAVHKGIEFPGHKHATLYDVFTIEPKVRSFVESLGIPIYFGQRISALSAKDTTITQVRSDTGDIFSAKSFVDGTGSSGPPGLCQKFGNGCVACIQRCPAFGPRQSLTSLLGLKEFMCTRRQDNFGAMSGSCKIHKETISQELRKKLERDGCVVIPIPTDLVKYGKLETKVCQQYALSDYAENIVLLDTGHAKLMSSFMPLNELRALPGLENARYADPLAGGSGNSIRLTAISARDVHMKVLGSTNLFVGGERAGVIVGHTEAIVTGALAGRNAALLSLGKPLETISQELAVGDFIALSAVNEEGLPSADGGYGLKGSHTFAGSFFFERMVERNLYTTDIDEIAKKVASLGQSGMFLT